MERNNKNNMLGYLYNSPEFRRINPLEVGSGKHKNNLNVWAKV